MENMQHQGQKIARQEGPYERVDAVHAHGFNSFMKRRAR